MSTNEPEPIAPPATEDPSGGPTTTAPPNTGSPEPETPGSTTTSSSAPTSTSTSTTEPSPPTVREPDLDAAGVAVSLPTGWEGVVYNREAVLASLGESTNNVVHLANFPLPADRGDYGSGAVEIMRGRDILIILFEFDPSSAGEVMFAAEGIPTALDPDDFDPNQMQRPLPGMAGIQRFFNIDGERAFCLFTVIASYANRVGLTAQINAVLAGVEISP